MGTIFSNVNSIAPAIGHLLEEFMASHVEEMVDTWTASTMNLGLSQLHVAWLGHVSGSNHQGFMTKKNHIGIPYEPNRFP